MDSEEAPSPNPAGARLPNGVVSSSQRLLRTRLGPITLLLPSKDRLPFISGLSARYHADEKEFLLRLGRISVRSRACYETVRDFVESVSGGSFAADRIAAITAVIDDELPRFLERELAHDRTAWRISRPSRDGSPPRALTRAENPWLSRSHRRTTLSPDRSFLPVTQTTPHRLLNPGFR